MSEIQTEQQAVKEQYQSSNNLNARIRLHQLFSTNPTGWFHWYIDQVSFPAHARVLELGCGPAALWKDQLDRLPADMRAILTDFSFGMVKQAVANVKDARFAFANADAQAIPFPTGHFDMVFANHMLYHVPERDRALAEVRRVLAPGGVFYAATNGAHHMEGLHTYSDRLFASATISAEAASERTRIWRSLWRKEFTLENGEEQIRRQFSSVRLETYPDGLKITQAQPLVEYILSLYPNLSKEVPQEEIRRFTRELDAEINQKGSIDISKETGVFIAL